MLGFLLARVMKLRHRRSSTQARRAASVVAPRPVGGAAVTGARAERECESVEIQGALVGLAVRHALGYRFVAMDHCVLDMTESIWPTLDDLRRAVAQRRRAFLRAKSGPFPGRRFSRSGEGGGSVLVDDVRLALNSFDW